MTPAPPPKIRKRLSKRPASNNYDVGYAKPPEGNRFKKGQSGNPNGRPKGRKEVRPVPQFERLKSIILEEAYRTIKVNDGDKQVTVPMAQAVMRSMSVAAAKGNARSQKLFADLLATTEAAHRQERDLWLGTAIQYKQSWEDELESRKALGILAPDPIPHPDDIIIHFGLNEVSVQGPMTKEGLADLDLWLRRKNDTEAELMYMLQELADPDQALPRDILQKDIDHTRRILGIIDRALALRASPACIQRRVKQLDLAEPAYLLKARATGNKND